MGPLESRNDFAMVRRVFWVFSHSVAAREGLWSEQYNSRHPIGTLTDDIISVYRDRSSKTIKEERNLSFERHAS